MPAIPCEQNPDLRRQIEAFAEVLKTRSHELGAHGLSEEDFYQGGLFRGAIERVRGQFSATMRQKREFVSLVLNHMQDEGFIEDWETAGEANRYDYEVTMPGGWVTAIELKGCLDGNNTNIFDRPPHAREFVMWSVCTNTGADPQHNLWSGIHTRLSAEIIDRSQQVDGLVVWDWVCGTIGRPCPKLERLTPDGDERRTTVGQYKLTPPCLYLFPATIPQARNNPNPASHTLQDVRFMDALHRCFGGFDDEVNEVRIEAANQGSELVRSTTIRRGGVVVQESGPTPIRRR